MRRGGTDGYGPKRATHLDDLWDYFSTPPTDRSVEPLKRRGVRGEVRAGEGASPYLHGSHLGCEVGGGQSGGGAQNPASA